MWFFNFRISKIIYSFLICSIIEQQPLQSATSYQTFDYCMNIEGFPLQNTDGQDHTRPSGILQFIIPSFSNSRVFKSGNSLQQSYHYNNSSPDYIIMREKYDLTGDHSALTYFFRISGNDLVVISCTENDCGEVTELNSGYPFIRLPDGLISTAQWEYQLSDEIRVSCQSKLVMREIKGKKYQELQVSRETIYMDEQICSSIRTIEYYIRGIGIYKIKHIHDEHSGMLESFRDISKN